MEYAAAIIFGVLLIFYVYFKVKKFKAYNSQSTAEQQQDKDSEK